MPFKLDNTANDTLLSRDQVSFQYCFQMTYLIFCLNKKRDIFICNILKFGLTINEMNQNVIFDTFVISIKIALMTSFQGEHRKRRQ